jgi:acyl carrier protein
MEEKTQGMLTVSAIQAWLVAQLSETLQIPPEEIDISASFDIYGLDSQAAVVLSGDLQEWLKRDLDPMIFFDYPTIEQLAKYLGEQIS